MSQLEGAGDIWKRKIDSSESTNSIDCKPQFHSCGSEVLIGYLLDGWSREQRTRMLP